MTASTVVNGVQELGFLVPEIWSTQMYSELRNDLVFGAAFNRDYEGELSGMGSVVHVQTIGAPTGQILTNDKDTFDPELLNISRFDVTANNRAVASFEITDMAQMKSQNFETEMRKALVYSISKQFELAIIASLVPFVTPFGPVTPTYLQAVDLAKARTLLSQALVPGSDRWAVLDPNYYGGLLQNSVINSNDFVPGTSSVSSGQFGKPIYGFTIAEHNLLPLNTGYFFHKSAVTVVMQRGVNFEISRLHSQRKFGYLISADMVFGVKLTDAKRVVKIVG